MPPRARKRQRVGSEPERYTRQSSTSPVPSSPEILEQEEDPETQPTFYNTTFSLHRVSPLYIGSQPLNRQRLDTLSQRLREVLVGDVVRGVEVGLAQTDGENGTMGRAGALEYVDFRWVGMGTVLGVTRTEEEGSEEEEEEEEGGEDGDDTETGRAGLDWKGLVERAKGRKALHILLRYEMAECTALLLPSISTTSSSDNNDNEAQPPTTEFSISGTQPADPPDSTHFLHLPLLLLRMPAPLKAVITDFLSTTFDCRISSLRLGTRSLVQSWESWISTAGLPAKEGSGKDVVISLGFYIPPPDTYKDNGNGGGGGGDGHKGEDNGQEALGIKSVDVIIPAAVIRQFVQAGKQIAAHQEQETESGKEKKEKPSWELNPAKQFKLAGRLGEEGWEWRSSTDNNPEAKQKSPFTEALGKYVDKHLGLNLFHPGVRVTKIACGGFVMSEGRLKIFTPREGARKQRAGVWKLVSGLVGKAEGGKPPA